MPNHADLPVSFPGAGIETRIDEVCRKIGGRSAAATAAGVSDDMLRRYIRGESKPTFEVVAKLARAAGVGLDWIASGEGTQAAEGNLSPAISVCADTLGNPVDLSEFVFIPRYSAKASAGHGSAVDGDGPIFSMAFRRYWIDKYLGADPKNLSVLSVKGDSMEGVLNDRDVILIDRADTHASAGLYVLRIDGGLFVKRVQRLPGAVLEISSANEAYKPFTVDVTQPPDDFAVVGRVVWMGRQI